MSLFEDLFLVVVGGVIASLITEWFNQKNRMQLLEKEINLRNITEKRAEIIGELHDYLMQLQDAIESYTAEFELSSEPTKEQKRKKWQSIRNELDSFFRKNCLYLPEFLETQIRVYLNNQQSLVRSFYTHVEVGKKDFHEDEQDHWGLIADSVKRELRAIQEGLKVEFRSLVQGVKK